jgi:prophage regulatory protein
MLDWKEKAMANTILRLPAVKTRVGLSRSTIYLAISRAEFPRPVQLGARSVGWLESEIENWICERVKHSQSCHESSAY